MIQLQLSKSNECKRQSAIYVSTIKTKLFKEVVISSWVRNLFNQNYISNAWVYRFNTVGDPTTYDFYANAEGTNSFNQIGAEKA